MPNGKVAPGWVLPTCGFGHHHVSASPWRVGRSVAELPMKGFTWSITGCLLSAGVVAGKRRSIASLPGFGHVTGCAAHSARLSHPAQRLQMTAPQRVGRCVRGGRMAPCAGAWPRRGRRAGARVRPLRGGGTGHARAGRAHRAPGRGRPLPARPQPDVPRGGRGHRRTGVAALAAGPDPVRGRRGPGLRRLRARVRAAHSATPVRVAVRGLPPRRTGVVAASAPVADRGRAATVGPRYGAGMSLVAGVDSSTQSCSVVVCDAETGQVLRSGHAAHPPGTEVSAQAWADAYAEATRDPALLEGVEALAVGGQQHGMVTLDSDGALVRDALLWNDNRSADDAVDLIAELGGPQAWADQVGSVPPASFTVTKLRWLARAEPENAERTAAVLLPHDRLTTVAAPDAVVGETPDGVRLAPGTGDNMAAGLGLGLTPGTAVVSLGTSGTAFTISTSQSHDPTGTVAGFADATGAFLPLVCTLNAARNLSATASLLGVDFAEFARLALSAPAGSGGLAFVPYLEGERTPPLPTATGELVGMSLANLVPANLARAAIEGILWSLAFGLRVLQEHGGTINRVILTGGGGASGGRAQNAPPRVWVAGTGDEVGGR